MKKKEKKSNLPVKAKAKSTELITVHQEKVNPLDITQKLQHLKNRTEVRKHLPEILGRVLARIWIDTNFKEEFANDPQKTLEFNGVYLPEDMSIEFQKPNSDRPRIVVYEQRPKSKFKLRVLYLQLVMMAGR
tara:strand:- start:156 stop:551 length:396 start_codon:yes stop_codon:yes gene_type:complete